MASLRRGPDCWRTVPKATRRRPSWLSTPLLGPRHTRLLAVALTGTVGDAGRKTSLAHARQYPELAGCRSPAPLVSRSLLEDIFTGRGQPQPEAVRCDDLTSELLVSFRWPAEARLHPELAGPLQVKSIVSVH